jgi:hypothetical protein
MCVTRFAALFVAAGLLASTALAQGTRIVKGQKTALRGMTKVYVDTQGDSRLADIVVAQLRRQLPEVAVVEAPGDDTILVRFNKSRANSWRELRSARVQSTQLTRERQPMYRDRPSTGAARRSASEPLPSNNSAADTPPQVAGRPSTTTLDVEPAGIVPTSSIDNARAPNAFGEVLTPAGPDALAKIVEFRQTVWNPSLLEPVVTKFVEKFARDYRKVNAPNP